MFESLTPDEKAMAIGWMRNFGRGSWSKLPFTRKEIYSWPETVSWKNFYSDRILEEFRIYLP